MLRQSLRSILPWRSRRCLTSRCRKPACSRRPSASSPEEAPLPRARVVAVDGAAGKITLDYPPIPEIFLEGGRRIFLVKDPATLKGLVKGDKVRFDVERDGRKYVITRLENTN